MIFQLLVIRGFHTDGSITPQYGAVGDFDITATIATFA
jgi:hypothetical protein